MSAVKVRKGNRIVTVSDALVDGYLKRGYDQVDESGDVVKLATGGKEVSVAEHNAALGEIEALKEEIALLKEKAVEFAERGKALQAENEALKKQRK